MPLQEKVRTESVEQEELKRLQASKGFHWPRPPTEQDRAQRVADLTSGKESSVDVSTSDGLHWRVGLIHLQAGLYIQSGLLKFMAQWLDEPRANRHPLGINTPLN